MHNWPVGAVESSRAFICFYAVEVCLSFVHVHLPYVQALLLARALRGDLEVYPPFFWK